MKPGRISSSHFRSAVAFALVLWCAGLGCLAHGMAMGASASSVNVKPAKTNPNSSEMAMTGHACCRARHLALQRQTEPATTFTVPEESSEDAASCCPLTSGSFVTTSRSQTTDNDCVQVAVPGDEAAVSTLVLRDRATLRRLSDHNRTYLTCCVFLI